jgi:site-specific recombinase XerD
MLDDDSDYDNQCQAIRDENAVLLGEFSTWLADAGLSAATIRSHRYNLDFYLNHFLLNYDTLRAPDGACEVGGFLGDWFIRKAAWASKTSIKANAASLKKFYTFMAEKGRITKEELAALKQEISEQMPEWLATLERYDNLDVDLEDVWPL